MMVMTYLEINTDNDKLILLLPTPKLMLDAVQTFTARGMQINARSRNSDDPPSGKDRA
jgi:hypothetical protein